MATPADEVGVAIAGARLACTMWSRGVAGGEAPVVANVGRTAHASPVSVFEPTVIVMRSAGLLVVDPRVHADEIARFTSHVVRGPTASDCDIWVAAIGADGYGRYYLTRQGMGL